MQRRQLLRLAATSLGAAAAGLAAPWVRAGSLIPIRFTLDFRISGQVAPFFVALYKGYL